MTLVLSPHLDDAVFSCGALLSVMGRNAQVTVVTCFTRSVPGPTGFALECQRDKGLADEVDYMALRRAEDANAMDLLGVRHRWLDLPEAPHRGYHSAPALFAGIRSDDTVAGPLVQALRQELALASSGTVLYPLGAGNHADHLQVVAAVEALRPAFPAACFIQYYDQPYTNRHPDDGRSLSNLPTLMPAALRNAAPGDYRYLPEPETLELKWSASRAYTTQLPFQFTTEAGMRQLLGREEYFHVR